MSRRLCLTLSTALLATAVAAAPAQAETLITDLGHLPQASRTWAESINDAGLAVGSSYGGGVSGDRAVQFDGFGTATEIVGPSRSSTSVHAVNSYSGMAGTADVPNVGTRAIRFDPDGTQTVLVAPQGYRTTEGLAIDDAGQVYGIAVNTAGKRIPVRWRPDGVLTSMKMPQGATSGYITGASSNGYVSGWVNGIGTGSLAVRWNPDGTVTMLAKLADGTASVAYAVNRFGEVVGNSDTSQLKYYGVRWNADGSVTTIGQKVYPRGLNDDGVAVGYADVGSQTRPFRWTRNGDALDLGLPDGVGGGKAVDINNFGVIVGSTSTAALKWVVR